jgi:hypothetical protein
VSDRLAGVLLFLPVPIVLFLFTRAPLGVGWSLGLGVAIMLTHRLYARPFALARADRRCLWCGGVATSDGPPLDLEEPLGPTRWRACSEEHASWMRRFLNWADGHRRFLQIGILGTLLAFLLAGVAVAAQRAGGLRFADAVNAFRLGIAVTVWPLGAFALRATPAQGPLRAPFPIHIQALIGTRVVSWLFRIVGLVWFAFAIAYFLRRA